MLCEGQGIEPDPEVMSKFIEVVDLPPIVQRAMEIYNNLSDTYVPGDVPIFIGKDKTALPFLYETFDISEDLRLFVLQIINIFDSQAVELSRKKVEQLNKKKNNRLPQGKPHGRPGAG